MSATHNYKHYQQDRTVLITVCGFGHMVERFPNVAIKKAEHSVCMDSWNAFYV